jgi:hypothetical protein
MVFRTSGNHQTLALKSLQAMQKHGSVDLFEDVHPNIDLKVRPNPKDVSVVGGVMQFAERDTVGDDRFPLGVLVWKNVCGVKQHPMRSLQIAQHS